MSVETELLWPGAALLLLLLGAVAGLCVHCSRPGKGEIVGRSGWGHGHDRGEGGVPRDTHRPRPGCGWKGSQINLKEWG